MSKSPPRIYFIICTCSLHELVSFWAYIGPSSTLIMAMRRRERPRALPALRLYLTCSKCTPSTCPALLALRLYVRSLIRHSLFSPCIKITSKRNFFYVFFDIIMATAAGIEAAGTEAGGAASSPLDKIVITSFDVHGNLTKTGMKT